LSSPLLSIFSFTSIHSFDEVESCVTKSKYIIHYTFTCK
jgi:hypothetical protein